MPLNQADLDNIYLVVRNVIQHPTDGKTLFGNMFVSRETDPTMPGPEKVRAIQELADAKTIAMRLETDLADLKVTVDAILAFEARLAARRAGQRRAVEHDGHREPRVVVTTDEMGCEAIALGGSAGAQRTCHVELFASGRRRLAARCAVRSGGRGRKQRSGHRAGKARHVHASIATMRPHDQ